MSFLSMTQTIPLTQGEDGIIRVTGSRVTLDSIVHQFKNGASAEQIQEDFPSLTLSDVYSVVAYYLQHTGQVEAYLNEQAQAAGEVRREVESLEQTRELRERLRQRRARAAA
jgi:uncharacterized protein (DUF433 family)